MTHVWYFVDLMVQTKNEVSMTSSQW